MARRSLCTALETVPRRCCVALLAIVVVQVNVVRCSGFSYAPAAASCLSGVCPGVVLSAASATPLVNVSMTSSNRTGTNNYFSVAIARGLTMDSALAVIDCYELGGNVTVGTSRNFRNASLSDNFDDPTLLSNLTHVSVGKVNGTLRCSFTINATLVVPPGAANVSILLAEGTMNTSTRSNPKKNKHFQSFALSASDLQRVIMPPSPPGGIPPGGSTGSGNTTTAPPGGMPGGSTGSGSTTTAAPGGTTTAKSGAARTEQAHIFSAASLFLAFVLRSSLGQ